MHLAGAMASKQISPAVQALVELMEQRFRVPGTDARFGIDALIGLVPGIGDFLGAAVGTIVLIEALRHGVGWKVLGRMLFNLWLDAAVGSIPVIGDLWDFYFKANRRNLKLLQKYA